MRPVRDARAITLVCGAAIVSSVLGQSNHKQAAQWSELTKRGAEFASRKDYKGAELAFSSALKLSESFGSNDMRFGIALNNLALVYRFESNYDLAEQLYERSLVIFEARYGATSSEVAEILQNLAICLREKGRYQNAEAQFLRALKIFLANLGPRNLNVVYVQQELGHLYMRVHKYAQARDLLHSALLTAEGSPNIDPRYLKNLRADYATVEKRLTDR
jgi:tetratricopeptide (TPR) repeat protein